MSFHPNTTLYLCTGTGLDMQNSVWWHRFAYPDTNDPAIGATWWNTCFQWVKAHAIAEGHWYYTMIDPARGWVKVGRNPLYSKSNPPGAVGQSGLGSAEKQAQLDDPTLCAYADAIRAVDYLCFSNNGDIDTQYAFVDKIVSVNWNTAIIYFTIDAIMTYQKFFHLGKCVVARDMEFQERIGSLDGPPNYEKFNFEGEPYTPAETDYVFQHFADTSQDVVNKAIFGPYNRMFCTTDIDLDPTSITNNEYYPGIPAFQPSEASKLGEMSLGIGGYFVPQRKNLAFQRLGSFNAMEHILYSYVVPENLTTENNQGAEPRFVTDFNGVVNNDLIGQAYDLMFPVTYQDSAIWQTASTQDFTPINVKSNMAPFVYYSITDNQGGSVEIAPQNLTDTDVTPTAEHYFIAKINFDMSVAPNTLSALWVTNILTKNGSINNPLYTLWQIPSYAMTPNNSGYNSNLMASITQYNLSQTLVNTGSRGMRDQILAQGIINTAGNTLATGLSTGGEEIGAGIGTAIAGPVGSAVGGAIGGVAGPTAGTAVQNVYNYASRYLTEPKYHYYSGILGGGVTAYNAAMFNEALANQNRMYGLPKVVGGLPSGFSTRFLNQTGYWFYVVHLRNDLLKKVDYNFSIFGYAQNKFRYPHINIRQRWCYVKLDTVNIIPQQANAYNMGGVPTELKDQIVQRLQAGVTFWNLRAAIMGAGSDGGASDAQSYSDSRIQSCINCKFIKNYGATWDSDEIKENVSYTGGYADDYDDDHDDR